MFFIHIIQYVYNRYSLKPRLTADKIKYKFIIMVDGNSRFLWVSMVKVMVKNKKNKGIEAAFFKVSQQKENKLQMRVRLRERARLKISSILNNKVKSSRHSYTCDDFLQYVKEAYQAEEITFADCLEYIPNKYHLIESLAEAIDPVSCLTEGYITQNSLSFVLFFPPLTESMGKFRARKNGFILLLSEEAGMVSSWWIGGNAKGYENFYREELPIFVDSSKEKQ